MPFQYGEGKEEDPGEGESWGLQQQKAGSSFGWKTNHLSASHGDPDVGNHSLRVDDKCLWGFAAWGGVGLARANESPLNLESKASVMVCASRNSRLAGPQGSLVRMGHTRGSGSPGTFQTRRCQPQLHPHSRRLRPRLSQVVSSVTCAQRPAVQPPEGPGAY